MSQLAEGWEQDAMDWEDFLSERRRAKEAAAEGNVTAGAWDESKHPRHPAGSEDGGEFASKTTAQWNSARMDFEQRKAQTEAMWQEWGGTDYSDFYEFWADEQFTNGGRSTLPQAWADGFTWGEDAAKVDKIIRRSPGVREDIAVYRGTRGAHPEGPMDRPTSTSFSKGTALAYADPTGRGVDESLVQVLIPAGTKVGWNSAELEVVLPSGTTYEPVGGKVYVARVPRVYMEDWASAV